MPTRIYNNVEIQTKAASASKWKNSENLRRFDETETEMTAHVAFTFRFRRAKKLGQLFCLVFFLHI